MKQQADTTHRNAIGSSLKPTESKRRYPNIVRMLFSDDTIDYIFAAMIELRKGIIPSEVLLTIDFIREVLELRASQAEAEAINEVISVQEADLAINVMPSLIKDKFYWQRLLQCLQSNHPNLKTAFERAIIKEILDTDWRLFTEDISKRHGVRNLVDIEQGEKLFQTALYFCELGNHALAQGFFLESRITDRSNDLYGLTAMNCKLHHIKDVDGVLDSLTIRSDVAKQTHGFLEAIAKTSGKLGSPMPSLVNIADLCYLLLEAKANYLIGKQKLAANALEYIIREVQYATDAERLTTSGIAFSQAAILQPNDLWKWFTTEARWFAELALKITDDAEVCQRFSSAMQWINSLANKS